ncbi:MAG TPA: thioredoxin family protein [Casimicrobiaceae bacterium]|nr:thioredoxin family protein [Casimicrobiaceae bacterium]
MRSIVTRFIGLAWLALAASSANAADLPRKFDASRDAATDVAYATTLAKEQGKRVIVDVGGEWCVWCHIMDRFIAANPDVRALIDANYVWLKVNFSKENENSALLGRWPKVEGYPHLFVLDAGGNVLHSQDTGELEAGKSYDKRKFLDMLRKWAPPGRTAAASEIGSEATFRASMPHIATVVPESRLCALFPRSCTSDT